MPTLMNPFDAVRAAGKVHRGVAESSELLCRDPVPSPAPSDASARREAVYRASGEPGVRVVHPGFRENVPHDGKVFGAVRRDGAETTGALLDCSQAPMAALITAKAEERAFLSTRRLPLGRGYVEGGALTNPPAALSAPGFAFGKPTTGYVSAKELLYPGDGAEPAAQERAELPYAKSHRGFPPGVQRRGGVDWKVAGVDPTVTQFGLPAASKERNAVGRCIDPLIEAAAGGAPAAALTALVPRAVDDFKVRWGWGVGGGSWIWGWGECARGRLAFAGVAYSSHPSHPSPGCGQLCAGQDARARGV